MAMSAYLRSIRERIGNDLLLLPSVTAMVWNHESELLLLRQDRDGPWTLPGGIIDPGECPAQSVVREVYEEAGLVVRPRAILAVFAGPEGFRRTYPNGHQVEYLDILFDCEMLRGSLGCRDNEGVEVRFFKRSDLVRVPWAFPIELTTLIQIQSPPGFKWEDRWLAELPRQVAP